MEELPGLRIEFPSYVDDLHCGLYDEGVGRRGEGELDRRESMGEWLDRASVVIKEVGAEFRLPLAEDKEEMLVLRDKRGRRGRRWTVEKVKWLGVLLDDELGFGPHWEYRIGKARKLLGAIDGVGNSAWGMSPLSWRQAYMGMIRAVTAWGVEIGWRGQKEGREMMEKLQYQALRKCTGAVVGAEKVLVRQIAAVEDVETFAEAAQGRFLARAISDPGRAGVPDPPRGIDGELSLGGPCWRGSIEVVNLGCVKE